MNGSVPYIMEHPAGWSLAALIHKCHQVVHRETVNGVILGLHRVIKFKDKVYNYITTLLITLPIHGIYIKGFTIHDSPLWSHRHP